MMANAVKVSRKAALDLLLGLGLGKNHDLKGDDNEKLESYLYSLPANIEKGTLSPASLTSERTRSILDRILLKLNDDEDITVVDDIELEEDNEEDNEDLFNQEEEEILQKEVPDDSEEAEKEYNAQKPAKPVKPAKPEKKVIELPEIDRKFKFTEIGSRLQRCTRKLTEEFHNMEFFPKDRTIKKARLEYHRQACANNSFRGPEWACVTVEATNTTYRMNGKHTSTVLLELFERGTPYPCDVLVRRYSCPTLEDAAHLFATFDAKDSARNKQDVLRGYAAANKHTADLSPKQLTVITSGISFSKMEESYRKLNTEDQALLLLENANFVDWFLDLIADKESKVYQHIMRMSVAAAMLKTWLKAKKNAAAFWMDVITGEAEEGAKGPRRTLYNLLQTQKVGGRDSSTRIGERELYVMCLKAFNAWRGNQPKVNLTYEKNEATPVVL